MNKDYLTVKEYAEKCSCSTQYVYKLLQTKLQPFVVLVDGKKCIDIKALEEFPKTDATNQPTNFATEVANSSASSENAEELKRINKRNEDIIDDLRAQLKEKDNQIKKQNDHIVELSNKMAELFENNQKLQLNYQLLLGDPKEKDNEIIEVDTESAPAREEIKEEPLKKGFFKRLFRL